MTGAIPDWIIKQMACEAVEKEAGFAGSQNEFTKNWLCWNNSTSFYDQIIVLL